MRMSIVAQAHEFGEHRLQEDRDAGARARMTAKLRDETVRHNEIADAQTPQHGLGDGAHETTTPESSTPISAGSGLP